ncbi:flagellar basal body-associated FliL family protein [Clostridium felsineum]|uniref:Flagellar protein FliL n=1 Tax=Clostridium felsineum TaxID=36839 RepID=A0A1S8MDF3_9CLOT|nr:flagellar basal body-associated protein FliL [Clostridium felsineum]URZ00913.1 hypothetical protein CLAUR_009010 [Clostridium felsineum]URZ06341.1 hypothetical protein CLROS_016740 [Clostridium felsineum]URZ11376.1 hypothetical protein CROST_020930 [Clostridium felsineum]
MSEKKKDKAEKGGGKSKLIIIVLVAIIVAFLVGALFYFFVLSKKAATTKVQESNTATQQESVEENTYSFDEIVTNLADTDSAKYVKITVAIGFDAKNSKLKEEIEAKEENIKTPIMRDIIVNVLRSKKAADFTPSGIEEMKKEIKSGINPHLKNGQINSVYFSNLVIQQ